MAAAQYYLIPLQGISQTFEIALAGVIYNLTVKWNDMMSSWILDIADANNVSIVAGIPFVTGDDLLDGLSYLGIGGSLYVYTNNGKYPDAVPDFSNLGTDINLYFFTSATNG